MGICNSSDAPTKEEMAEKNISKEIENKMVDQNLTESQVNKLLLLGAGESGKSTLFKQFTKLYGDGFTADEIQSFVPVVYSNTIQAIKTLSVQSDKFGGLTKQSNQGAKVVIDALQGDELIDSELSEHIANLWADEGIQKTYAHSAEYQITDSAAYFMGRIKEYGKDAYTPSFQDMFRTRVRTTGIVELKFEIEGNFFAVFDVGGQRNERKKWIHCFESVTAVLFVAGISGYDQTLYEDEKTNRMVEALNLFEETCNSRWFPQTAMILFLNKLDIFQEKITRVPLKICFEDYDGPNEPEPALTFIIEKFEERNKVERKSIYIHVTTATDTDNVHTVFKAVKDIIIRTSLKEAGLVTY